MKTSVWFLVALMLLLPGILCSVIKGKCKNFGDFITNSALWCVIMLHLEVKARRLYYRRFVFWRWGAGRDKNKENLLGDEMREGHLYLGSLVISKLISLMTEM